MSALSHPTVLGAKPEDAMIPTARTSTSGLSRIVTAEKFLQFWNDPNRPRLTPVEAADFEADIKAARTETESVPLRGWE